MPRDEQPVPGHADDLADRETSRSVIAKWRRLTPNARNVLARVTGREPLATNLRKARENRGLSQAAVAKKLRLSRSLVAQIELANRPVSADELAKFADLYGTPAVELAGTRVDTDDPVTATLLNLAPALLKEFDMQSRIHGVLGALMAASQLERLLERPARTGPPTYPLPSPRTLADAIRQGEEIAEHERQRLGLRDAPLPELADLCAAQGVPVFALKLPDELSGLFIAACVCRSRHCRQRHPRRGSSAAGHRAWLRACRVRADGHDPGLHQRERQGADRTTRGGVCGRLPPARSRRRRNGASSRQGPAESAGVLGVRCGDGTVRARGRTLDAGIADDDLPRWRVDRPSIWDDLRARHRTVAGAGADCRIRPPAPPAAHGCRARAGVPGPSGSPSARVSSSSASNAVVALSDLPAERFYMAVEAYRRGLMTKADLASEAVSLSLQLPGLSESRLLELAEAAR